MAVSRRAGVGLVEGATPLRVRLVRSTALVAVGFLAVATPAMVSAQVIPPNMGGAGGGPGGAGGQFNSPGAASATGGGGGGGPSDGLQQPGGAGFGGANGGSGGIAAFNGFAGVFGSTTNWTAAAPFGLGGPTQGNDFFSTTGNEVGAGAGGGGAGGFGVILIGTGNASTTAAITGGLGAVGGYGQGPGYGNPVSGGGGGDGGVGLYLSGNVAFTNGGTIVAGDGGGGGSSVGTIGGAGGAGGAGAFSNATSLFTNAGNLVGGNGGTGGGAGDVGGYFGTGGTGGIGGAGGSGFVATSVGAQLFNGGTIQGGAGGGGGYYTGTAGGFGGAGGAGGDGVRFNAAGQITNSGTITGGIGGGAGGDNNGVFSTGGAGGAGVRLIAGGTILNAAGLIQGGQGGDPVAPGAGTPGPAGAGIDAQGGGTVTNAFGARISGGFGSTDGGAPGVGITGANLTVVNDGVICGGPANGGTVCGAGAGLAAAAVTFTGGANTLVLYSRGALVGDAIAVAGGTDVLALGGAANGTFNTSAIGSQFQNFASYQKVDGSTWTLTSVPQPGVATPWTILAGTLSIANDASLGPAAGGTLTVSGGTLQTTASTTASRAIVLGTGGGTFDVATATTYTTQGQISGAGSLTKVGAGTMVVGAPATYTGATAVNAGTLQGGAANVFSAGSATTINTGGTLDLGGFAQRINAVTLAGGTLQNGALTGAVSSTGGAIAGIGGTASLTTTSGTTSLLGANSFSGPTLVAGGTLRAGSATGLSPSSAFTINGTLDVNGFNSNIGSLAGSGLVTNNGGTLAALTTGGSGASTGFGGVLRDGTAPLRLIKAGAGTFSLSGANSYSGGTRVLAGTVLANGPGSLGSGALELDQGTTLAFAGTGYTLPNSVVFTGAFDPTIDSGAGTIGMSGVISGPGDLTKIGTGTLVLTGQNTYTGNTFVNVGRLQVDGSIASSPLTTIASGASLAGVGTVGGIAALAGSTVSPGNAANPFGVLTATGNVTFANGSTLATNVIPNVASRLAAAGTATLATGSAVAVSPGLQTFTAPARIPILTAGRGVNGQFSTVSFTSTVLGIQPTVVYDANNAYLQFGDTNPVNPAGPPILPPLDVASTVGAAIRLAGERQGLFVTNRVLASMLMGFNEQINCQDCITGFGSAGSFSLGAHGRKFLTNDLSVIGGAAFAEYRSGGVHVTSAPILAGVLRYDVTELGPSRPFAEVGGFLAPGQRATSTRSYGFGAVANGGGKGSTSVTSGSVFGRLGWVARLTPQDEVAGGVEVAGGWQHFGGYSEGALPSNPYPIASAGGTDRMNLVKVGGQWTHLFGASIETQFNAGIARSFGSRSGLNASINAGALPISLGEYTWGEYGARIGYRLQQNFVIDAFADGTIGAWPIGNTIHGGLAARYAF